MPKLTSYIKALLPNQKNIRILPNVRNLIPISPKDQNDIAGLVIPKVGANTWAANANVNIELLQKYYDCHDLVYSCIDLVSSTFATAEIRVKKYDAKTGRYNYLPDHPLQILLDNPNSSMTGYDLRQAYIVHRLLYGTIGCLLIRDGMTVSNNEANMCPNCRKLECDINTCTHIFWHFNTGPITQIIPIHPDRLSKEVVKMPSGREQEFFVYTINEQNKIKSLIHPNNILTDPLYNPGGSFYGSSPTARVQRWLEIDLGLSKQIGAYLVNNAIPSMILNLKPPKVGEGSARLDNPATLLEMMKEKWLKEFSMSYNNEGYTNRVKTPAFMYGDVDVIRVQDGIKDIVQKPLFYEIQDRIARAYKIPPTFFEYGVNYSEPTDQNNKDFYNRAISPQLISFLAKIRRYILPSYNDPDLEIEWNLSSLGIAGFLEDRKEAKILKRWEMGLITRNETREFLQLNPVTEDLGDDFYRIDVLGTNSNGERLNQPSEDNILKPNPKLSRQAGGSLTNESDI